MTTPRLILFSLFVLLLPLPSRGAPADTLASPAGSNFIPWRFVAVAGGTAGLITAAHFQNYNSWWKGERGPFHLSVDDGPPLGADKCGHFLFSYYASDIIGRSLAWSGIERRNAILWGALISSTFQLYVETEDAFHPGLGFSIGDAFADGLGAFLPLLQERSRFFRAISPKWSFHPSQRYREGAYRSLIDDYESQTYWLSFNLEEFLGTSVQNVLPSFLNVAIGYGVSDLDLSGGGNRELYIGFDIDFNKLPGEGEVLGAVKHVLNFLHFPAPAIRLTPTVVAYGLRF